MAINTTWPGPSGVTDQTEARRDLNGMLIRSTANVARAGVFPHTSAALVTSLASMFVSIAPFNAALVRGGGPLLFSSDTTATQTVGVAPGANSVYSIVWVKQNETASPYSDANDTALTGYTQGTASASPSLSAALAAIPAGALALAAVLIPSTATTTQSAGVVITNLYPYTCMTGGVLLFRDATEQAAFIPGDGQKSRRLDTDTDWTADGGVWVQDDALYGITSSLVGGTVPAGAKILRQAGLVASAATNASGDTNFAYPTAFPNGVIAVSFQRHNYAAGLGPTIEILASTQGTGNCNFRVYDMAGAALGAGVTLGYTFEATGW